MIVISTINASRQGSASTRSGPPDRTPSTVAPHHSAILPTAWLLVPPVAAWGPCRGGVGVEPKSTQQDVPSRGLDFCTALRFTVISTINPDPGGA